ncbi:MAG: TM2 domain-containing protein [Oscillospiraceae bacterium]|nr:TM2 domain-containing protein [Oscillospiraceae bacterium]
MFCKNCGAQMNENAAFCVTCGAAAGQGTSHCANCGNEVAPGAAVCLKCGAAVMNGPVAPNGAPVGTGAPKSKIAAGLLGIFLGSLGVHNFMLGFTGKAVAQLVMTVVGWILAPFTCGITALAPAAAGVWGLVEGIMILTGSIATDANGVPLQ